MKTILLVGLGGGIGSILRYFTALWLAKYAPAPFPLATFAVNILGCLLIGLLSGLLSRYYADTPELRYLFITGFCGGYTTFSTFALENLQLAQAENGAMAFFYIVASTVGGVVAAWLGLKLAQLLMC
jgi:fluoride exporter